MSRSIPFDSPLEGALHNTGNGARPISCRNRHCPKCQGALARQWLAEREAELLPLAYFHVVFTVPSAIGEIAYLNKALLYDLLFKAAAEALLTIGADPKHLGARLGLTAVLHTWGSAMTHHPHLHCIVPGGGLSLDGQHWVASRPHFFLPVKVLSRRFRRVFLDKLCGLYHAGRLVLSGKLQPLHDPRAFTRLIATLRHTKWYVDARAPFAGPDAVFEYLSRYTHRVAIANSRLIHFDAHRVIFKWKDYRAKAENRYKTMSLETPEFIRRFLIHVLPHGFHRIRYYGLFANGQRAENLAKARELLAVKPTQATNDNDDADDPTPPDWLLCPACGATMRIIEIFEPGHAPPAPPYLAPGISPWGEEGFSSCLARPCHHAVATHPAEVVWSSRSDFGQPCCLRPPVAGSAFEATHFRGHLCVHSRYGLHTR